MAKKAVLGRVIVLILLIIILIFAGLWWFDYLGLIRARNTFEPLYSLLGIKNDTALSSQALATADKSLSVVEIAKAAKISEQETLLGMGWLFKEGKIKAEENKITLA